MARNRIIYASQSVWANGEVLYRVQTLGSTTTFTSEDIFELGHQDIIDVVDDVPAVAVTLNTNEFGDVKTFAILSQVRPDRRIMETTASGSNANLVVVSGTNLVPTSTYLHGASLADFAIVCGNLPGVTIWAPVQDECSLGTLDNNIDQTLFMDEVFINSFELSYTTGANATENYGGETDNKMWLLNAGRFVNYDSYTLTGTDISNGYVDLTLGAGGTIPTLSTNKLGFLRKDDDGNPAATWFDATANEMKNVKIAAGASSVADQFTYQAAAPHRLHLPPTVDGVAPAAGDILQVVYCADQYGTGTANAYFTALDNVDRPDMIGAVRQGQVEAYIVGPNDASWDIAWRLTGVTITSDLTREALLELGHLSPYDRPLTLPIPITVTVDSTMGDLENWSKVANQLSAFEGSTLDDIDLSDLMTAEDNKLVVKIYAQTDEEAAGTGDNRTLHSNTDLVGQSYFLDGVRGVYASAGETEHALKTVIVEHLKITDEGATLDLGTNMTQTFGFRSTNDLYVVKGDLSIQHITGDYKVRRNA